VTSSAGTGESLARALGQCEVSIYDGAEAFLRQYAVVRPEVGHLYAAHWCQSEVCNGGFRQLFANSTGVLAPEAVSGFRAIGCHEWAALLEAAMARLGSSYPREREERVAALESLSGQDAFDDLDRAFYAWLEQDGARFHRAADEYADRLAA
jgi:hypothetical protein